MKFAIALFVVAILATVANGAALEENIKPTLSSGNINPGDRLLQRQDVYLPARANAIQTRSVTYRGSYGTRISAVTATEVGDPQYASAWIVGGGLGLNTVTLRVQSARGNGLHFVIDVWGQ